MSPKAAGRCPTQVPDALNSRGKGGHASFPVQTVGKSWLQGVLRSGWGHELGDFLVQKTRERGPEPGQWQQNSVNGPRDLGLGEGGCGKSGMRDECRWREDRERLGGGGYAECPKGR